MALRDYQLRRNGTYLRRGGAEGHSIREYDTPSLYQQSYAFMVNNSLLFVVVIAALYRLAVR